MEKPLKPEKSKEAAAGYRIVGTVERKGGEKYERRIYEYRDASGKLQAEGIVDLVEGTKPIDEELADEERNGTGRVLKRFILRSRREGWGAAFDVMPIADDADVEEIVVADRPLKNYSYSDQSRRVISPPLDSPFNIAILLHELGHARQYKDKREGKKEGRPESKLEKLMPIANWARRLKVGGLSDDANIIEAMIKGILEIDSDARASVYPEILKADIKNLHSVYQKKQKIDIDRAAVLIEQDELEQEEKQILIDVVGKGMQEKFSPLDRLIEQVEDKIYEREDSRRTDEAIVGPWRSKLEAAGIFLSHQKKDAQKEEENSFVFGEARPAPPELGAEDIKNLNDVKVLLKALRRSLQSEADIDYDGGKKQMVFRFSPGLERSKFSAKLVLDTSPEDFAAFEERRAKLAEEADELERKKVSIEEKIKNIESEYQKILDGLEHIVKLPVIVEERDATYRAMRDLVQLRDRTGIDFLHKEFIPLIGGATESDCAESVRDGVHDLIEKGKPHKPAKILKKALGTYGASHPPHTERKKK